MNGLRSGRSAVQNLAEEWLPALPGLTCLVGAPLATPLDPKAVPRKFRRTMGPVALMAHAVVQWRIHNMNYLEALKVKE